MVGYEVAQPTTCLGTNASVAFTFEDHPHHTQIEFGFNGLTFLAPVDLSDGTVIYDVPLGPLALWARWADGGAATLLNADDPILVSLDSIEPPCDAPPEAAYVIMQPTLCDGSDASVTFTFQEHPSRTHVQFSFDGVDFLPPVPLSSEFGQLQCSARSSGVVDPMGGWRI